jgi:hypothetical protein
MRRRARAWPIEAVIVAVWHQPGETLGYLAPSEFSCPSECEVPEGTPPAPVIEGAATSRIEPRGIGCPWIRGRSTALLAT